MWYVVKFTEENTVAAVPVSWYISQSAECFWPPKTLKKTDLSKYVRNKYLPAENWKPYPAVILGTYDDYNKTCRKVIKAQESDKLSTEVEEEEGRGKRRKTSNKKYSVESVETDSDDANNADSENSLEFPQFPSRMNDDQQRDDNVEVRYAATGKGTSQSFPSLPCSPPPIIPNEKRPLLTCSSASNSRNEKRPLFFRTYSRSLSPDHLSHHTSKTMAPKEVNAVEKRCNDNSEQILNMLRAMSAENREFKTQVMRKLHIINLKLLDLQSAVETSITKEKNEEIDEHDENFESIINLFPLGIDNIQTIENWLQENRENKVKLAKHLSLIGGSDVSEIIKRILYKMFTDELGSLYSWEGAKGKKKFKLLLVSSVIQEAVRLTGNGKNATEAEIITNIKKWLVKCKERLSRKNKNNESGLGTNNEEENERQTNS